VERDTLQESNCDEKKYLMFQIQFYFSRLTRKSAIKRNILRYLYINLSFRFTTVGIDPFCDSQSCPKLDTDLLTRVRTKAIFSLVFTREYTQCTAGYTFCFVVVVGGAGATFNQTWQFQLTVDET
jgi:hypothetical protein